MAKRMKELEDKSDVFWYYASVLNPLSYLDSFILDPTEEKVKTKAEHAAVGYALYSIPTYATWLLSGGGATPSAARGVRPGWLVAQASKKHIQSTVVRSLHHAAQPLARFAPAAIAAAFAVDMVANPLDSFFMRGAESMFNWIDPWNISDFTFMD